MSKLEHWQLLSATDIPIYGEAGEWPMSAERLPPVHAARSTIVEYAVIVGIFAAWAGFWSAVIWWIAA